MKLARWSGQGSDFSYEDLAADLVRLHQHQLAADQIEAKNLQTFSSQCKEPFESDIKEKIEGHKLHTFLPGLRKQPVSTASLGHGTPAVGDYVVLHAWQPSHTLRAVDQLLCWTCHLQGVAGQVQ